MKYFTLVPVFLLSLTSVSALAVGQTCKTIEGHIEPIIPDSACTILNKKPNHFPEATFFFERPDIYFSPALPAKCFSGVVTGTIIEDNKPVTGTFFSGITTRIDVNDEIADPMPLLPHTLTAASAILFKANNSNGVQIELGQIFTKDLIHEPFGFTNEILTMVDGTKRFAFGHGGLEIHGNALLGADFTAKLCSLNLLANLR